VRSRDVERWTYIAGRSIIEQSIAAEADTAKPVPKSKSQAKRFAALDGLPSDRLADAMIEAATYAPLGNGFRVIDYIEKTEYARPVLSCAIKAALRARESAPAVETPPNSA
jgi:hypothetical protein